MIMCRVVLILLMLLSGSFRSWAAGDMEALLPSASCGQGWKIAGKPQLYDRENLSERINGEAELYMPYGFERMAAARYSPEKSPEAGIDVEIYRMGSLLDAFGMFANYRQKEGVTPDVAADSNLSGSQLFLYQGRHFVHIQMTGTEKNDSGIMMECAREVAARLPGDKSRPKEFSVFALPQIVKGTERYLPSSLLGYDFLNRGLMADATIDGTNAQIFRLLDTSAASATAAFEKYRTLLGSGKASADGKGNEFLEGVDSLYGPVTVIKRGNSVAGALKYGSGKGVRGLLQTLCR